MKIKKHNQNTHNKSDEHFDTHAGQIGEHSCLFYESVALQGNLKLSIHQQFKAV
jgi:hypothetical protein